MVRMYGYVYITTNLVNGKQYIGRHKSETFDENYKGSGILIHKALEKYGSDNFECEVLCECFSNDELNDREKYYIQLYDAVNNSNFYSIAQGGQGGDLSSGREVSEETRRKISAANTGKVRTEERRKQQSEFMKGNKFLSLYKTRKQKMV